MGASLGSGIREGMRDEGFSSTFIENQNLSQAEHFRLKSCDGCSWCRLGCAVSAGAITCGAELGGPIGGADLGEGAITGASLV